MITLLDTHLLMWAAEGSDKLPAEAAQFLLDPENEAVFSAASIWEIAIKSGLGRTDFTLDAGVFRGELMRHGYQELPVSGLEAAAVAHLPPIHRDPFDRLLVAQARVKGMTLMTSDPLVAQYGPPTLLVT